MSEAIMAVRCPECGWALLDDPKDKPILQRWIACNNPHCSETGKKYTVPTFLLHAYRGKDQ